MNKIFIIRSVSLTDHRRSIKLENKRLLNLLLVEDDEDHAHFIMSVLKKDGLVVRNIWWVKNGQEAIDYLSKTKKIMDNPNIILLDIKMPIMNGFEVLKWLKANDKYKIIPVIILTTSGMSEDIQKALQIGANDYLVKPVRWVSFKRKIREFGKYWSYVSDSYV